MYAIYVQFCSADDFKIAYGHAKHLLFDASNVCRTSGSEIIFLEHAEIEANLEYSRRGALEMYLRSPSGIDTHFFTF